MRPDMIPSETVIEEAHEDSDDEDIDFSDGMCAAQNPPIKI